MSQDTGSANVRARDAPPPRARASESELAGDGAREGAGWGEDSRLLGATLPLPRGERLVKTWKSPWGRQEEAVVKAPATGLALPQAVPGLDCLAVSLALSKASSLEITQPPFRNNPESPTEEEKSRALHHGLTPEPQLCLLL